MAHPYLLAPANTAQQSSPASNGGGTDFELREAILAALAPANLPAEQMRHQLLPVANPEHRRPRAQQPGINRRTPRIVNARRPAGNDDALAPRQFHRMRLARSHIGIHAQVADLASDQVAVLPPSVQDSNLRLHSLE